MKEGLEEKKYLIAGGMLLLIALLCFFALLGVHGAILLILFANGFKSPQIIKFFS
jgi:hypothetical protein